MNTSPSERSRTTVVQTGIEQTRNDGYLTTLDDELSQVEDPTPEQDVLRDALTTYEWESPTYVREFVGWVEAQDFRDILPTVETDLTRHSKCLGCGANVYVHNPRSCGCSVGLRDGDWYDCLDCGDEYRDTDHVDGIPLCPSCRDLHISQAKSLKHQ